jgi:hypothetical protein
MSVNKLDSGIHEFVTGDPATEVVTPITDALRTGDWSEFKLEIWFAALVGAKARIGVQFSNNPAEFTDAAKELETTYITANGWTRPTTVYDLFNVTGATPRTWFRLVVHRLNTSGGLAGSGQVRVLATKTPLAVFRRIVTPFVRANTKGSDSAPAKTPLCDGFLSDGITEHRLLLDVACFTGPLKVQVQVQETDTPDDPSTWAHLANLGGEVTTAAVTFPTTFGAVAPTKRYLRYVASVKNDTGGTDIESVVLRVVVEARG